LASHRAIFAIHRCRRAAAAPTTHTRGACRGTRSPSRCQHRGFLGSSRREEALKKPSAIGSASGSLPSPPNGMRSFPGERPLHAQSRSRKQAKQQHRTSLDLTSFIQHRSINSGDLAALLGRSSGMVRRYGGHARYTAAGSRFARSAPPHCC
jgi:hypothetical protein